MSLIIKLYTNNSEDNKVSKSLSKLLETTGVLKESTSLIDPIIKLKISDTSQLAKCNYLTITTFGRSYFVKDIKSVLGDVWELSCHVDVLSSFKTNLLKLSGIIERQSENYNLMLDDAMFRVYQNPHIITKEFPNGFGVNSSYILLVSGGSDNEQN